ncbi:hypothetical protein LINPERPRIM_LOCUS19118, partial [Linum perenne]
SVSWDPASPKWVTLNSGGSVFFESRQAAPGGLVWDSQGCYLVEFSMNLSKSSINRIELSGVVSCLQLP